MAITDETEETLVDIAEMGQGDAKEQSRDRTIVRTSVIGILANVFLAAFKAIIGTLTHSIAIVLDAVNNLSDAAASIITIIGTKLAGRPADKAHPFGYGRIEYLSAMVISLLVLYAGITSFVESVKAIVEPATPDYNAVALVIVAVGVLVKVVLGRYVKGVGERVNSDSLINSGTDATLDSIISASTLVAALIFIFTGLSLEAWLGAIISIVIIKSGIEMLVETLSKVLGERADAELAHAIRATITEHPDVIGAYDLIINDYGPDMLTGSVHVEVDDTCTAAQIDELTREVTSRVYQQHQVILVAVGVYAHNTSDEAAIAMRERVYETALAHEHVLRVHGFYLNEKAKTIRFDVVVGFDAKDRMAVYEDVCREVGALYPDYRLIVALDSDFNDAE